MVHYWLVVSTPLKNMKVNGKDYPHMMENKKCLKPPTRLTKINYYLTIYISIYMFSI